MGKPREIQWSWESQNTDVRVGYMAVDGRMSITDLIAYMETVAPGVALDDIDVNWATVKWTRPADAEELAQRKRVTDRHQARHEAWERETLTRLKKKHRLPARLARKYNLWRTRNR